MAFRYSNNVGTRNYRPFAAQWLAYGFPYRRFGRALASTPARLGADVVRYAFIVMDLHHLLPAGLPAHYCRRSQAAIGARAAKRVTRVLVRGTLSSQCTTRAMFIAAAVQTCWSPVLASPMYRLRCISNARTPCDSVPSIPALTRQYYFQAGSCIRARAAFSASCSARKWK